MPAEQALDALAESDVDRLPAQGLDARLGLGADPGIGQPRRDRSRRPRWCPGRGRSRSARRSRARCRASSGRGGAAGPVSTSRATFLRVKTAERPRRGAVERGHHRGGDRPRAEERTPGRAVGEAGVRQVHPPRRVERPARGARRPARARRRPRPASWSPGGRGAPPRCPRRRTAPRPSRGPQSSARRLVKPPTIRAPASRGKSRGDRRGRPRPTARARSPPAPRIPARACRPRVDLDGPRPDRSSRTVWVKAVVVGVVDPALHHPLVAVAAGEERRADHRARYFAGSASNFTLQSDRAEVVGLPLVLRLRGRALRVHVHVAHRILGHRHRSVPHALGWNRPSRRLLATTDTDERAMASPARIGESWMPQIG